MYLTREHVGELLVCLRSILFYVSGVNIHEVPMLLIRGDRLLLLFGDTVIVY